MNAPAKIEASTLHSAMALAFGQIESATKSANNPHFKSKYADLTTVIEAIKPALIGNSLFFTQHCAPHEKGVQIETFLHHASGESISLGVLFVPANKQDAQGFGSALTYARRYALVTAFGVPVEDDDGNAASRPAPRAETPKSEPCITDEQVTELELLLPAAKLAVAKFNQSFNIARLPDLPASKYEEAKERIADRMATLAKQATDAKAKEPA